MTNKMKEMLKKGETCYGTWVTIPHPDVMGILSRLGFDFAGIDMEHSTASFETVANMLATVSGLDIPTFVRVGKNDEYLVKQVLDSGSGGVLIPQVMTRQDAEMAIQHSKYPPMGARGFGPRRASDFGTKTNEYARRANNDTLVALQIENVAALNALDEILGVQGVDVAMVGPADLSMSMGLFFDKNIPALDRAYQRVADSCARHDVSPGIIIGSEEELKKMKSMGYRAMVMGSDVRYLTQGAKGFLQMLGR